MSCNNKKQFQQRIYAVDANLAELHTWFTWQQNSTWLIRQQLLHSDCHCSGHSWDTWPPQSPLLYQQFTSLSLQEMALGQATVNSHTGR